MRTAAPGLAQWHLDHNDQEWSVHAEDSVDEHFYGHGLLFAGRRLPKSDQQIGFGQLC